MRFKDRFYEAKYHLRRLREECLEAQKYNSVKPLHRFRFEFNSLVVASRSIIFVLNKDFKHYGEKFAIFKTWYTDLLSKYKFFVGIRNQIEKEGSHSLIYRIHKKDDEGNIWQIDWDYSGDDVEQFLGWVCKFGLSLEYGDYFPAGTSTSVIANSLLDKIKKDEKFLFGKLKKGMCGETIKIEVKLSHYSNDYLLLPTLVTLCGDYLILLEQIVTKADTEFRK